MGEDALNDGRVHDRGDELHPSGTAAARDAAGRSRPPGTRVRSPGSHRLRGLREPRALFQVETADLPAHFPPLRTT